MNAFPAWLSWLILGFCFAAPIVFGGFLLYRRVNRGKDLKIGPDA